MNTKKIFVRLLNEGTDVWCPVMAEELGGDIFRIIDDGSYDPNDEKWEFLPGSKVICKLQRKSSGEVLVAVSYYVCESP